MLLAHLIPPEQLLSALLLQVFYGIRSERQLIEQLDYNLSKDRQ
jgi:transposase